jgi:NAD(P)-dependent dehydrogenase (short-subunit alcohol dehydrogenase family)
MTNGLLAGRSVMVTGACGGIGRASSVRLVEEGAVVHGLDCDVTRGRELAAELGPRFVFHAVDLADRAALDASADACLEATSGKIDVLFNNAAISIVRRLEDTDDATLDALWQVNVFATVRLCRRLLPAMAKRRRGVILNTASELSLVGMAGYTAYCASKGAVLAFTRALAIEAAPVGIRVNALCPGPTDTPMLRAELASAPDPAAERAENERSIPLGRLGRPEEIAEVALFLVSDRSAFVHGAAMLADGGKTAW